MIPEHPGDPLTAVRRRIDALDGELLGLLARRQDLVKQAGLLKSSGNARAVAAPERVTEVINARRASARECGVDPDVAEAIWQAMIQAFIRFEMRVNQTPLEDELRP